MSIDRALVDAALAALTDANTGHPYTVAKGVRNVTVDGDTVGVEIVLGYPAKSQFDAVRAQVEAALAAVPGVKASRVAVRSEITAHTV
ncbi:iron-sulfur cluster assembly protein, partial [Paraburkholderia sp. BR14261]